MAYCSASLIEELSDGTDVFYVGERVACVVSRLSCPFLSLFVHLRALGNFLMKYCSPPIHTLCLVGFLMLLCRFVVRRT
ncbi:hypothetical protein DPX39_090067700 [Trypanosoma brucei equiperdum]|uniref:Uncharacterized protein n=1 Tax=Trypanosoma brucei equiperdum TaxID=630700 RepID=A0A3L6L258_9TRYP|nr:hypothetical protein DPX39_090067700 [Trypanosoma brucei equiperdum]